MNEFCGFGHGASPARWSDRGIVNFLVYLGELAGVEPDAAAVGALIDFDAFEVGEPFAVEDLFSASRARTRLGKFFDIDGGLPDGVERGGGAGGDAFKFVGVKPDAAAAAITHIECHAAGVLLEKRVFACGALHSVVKLMDKHAVVYSEFYVMPKL